MNRAKSALIALTVLLFAAGAALIALGTITGLADPKPQYPLVWTGVGLLVLALLTLIVTLAAVAIAPGAARTADQPRQN